MYRGPQGTGVTAESLSSTGWSSKLVERWRTEVNTGFSSFCVADGKAFTLMTRDIEGNPTETVVAFDAENGRELWAAPLTYVKYAGGGSSGARGNDGGNGPMSTPSFAEGRLFVTDANIGLHALDANTGRTLWKRDIVKEHEGQKIKWDNAASPLLEGNLVLLAGGGPGESLLAFRQQDGSLAWKSGDEKMTHATPVAADIHGVRQVIFFLQSGLVSVDPSSGRELWRQEFPFKVSTAASPVVDGDIVYCSAGYGVGAGAYRISKNGNSFSSKEIWRTENENINHWSTPVLYEGHLYGMFSFKKYGDGPLSCVDIKTGEMKWSEAGFGPGHVILADDKVLALGDAGQLVLIDPNPRSYKELARKEVLDGKCWTTPVLSGGRIYVRSTTEGKCLEVR